MHGSPQVCDSTFRVCRYKPQKVYVNFLRCLHLCDISSFPAPSVPQGEFICPGRWYGEVRGDAYEAG